MSHAIENQHQHHDPMQLKESEGAEMGNSLQPPAFQLKASPASGASGGGPLQLATGVIQREPTSKQAGTVKEFIKVFNNTTSQMGTKTGEAAHKAMLRLGETELTLKGPLPKTTPYFNTKPARYIYTTKGGWIDMTHFLFHAGRAYMYKQQKTAAAKTLAELKAMPWYKTMFIPGEVWASLTKTANQSPVGESVQEGFMTERMQQVITPRSAFSYEDLPSDTFGAQFAVQHFNSNLKKTFAQQLEDYLTNVLGATEPKNAPNFGKLPAKDTDKVSRQNFTTKPVYTKDNP